MQINAQGTAFLGARRVCTDTPVSQTTTATIFTYQGIINTADYAAETIVCHNLGAGLIPPHATAFPRVGHSGRLVRKRSGLHRLARPDKQCQQARE